MKALILVIFFLSHNLYSINIVDNFGNISSNNEYDNKIHSVFVQILNISAEQSVKIASSKNGFYSNPMIKIPFPKSVINLKSKLVTLGLKKQIEEFEYKINIAAEKASKQAVNIFILEINNLKMNDVKKIINSDKGQATKYFKNICYVNLYNSFLPIVTQNLNNEKASMIWSSLLKRYNNIPFVKKIEFDLYDYVTQKAIDGIFVLMAENEKNIRLNPKESKSDIIINFFN